MGGAGKERVGQGPGWEEGWGDKRSGPGPGWVEAREGRGQEKNRSCLKYKYHSAIIKISAVMGNEIKKMP